MTRPLKVLVVDDDYAQRRILTRQLEEYTVVTATSGEEARPKIAANGYDVIVVDLVMPGMSGLELLREIHHRDPDMPVIIVTAMSSTESAFEAGGLAATRYLVKPVPREVILAEVRRAGQLHDAARARRRVIEAGPTRAERRAELDLALLGLWMAYQPIVDLATKSIFAYEALLRTPTMTPDRVIDAAHDLGELEPLGRRVRAAVAAAMTAAPVTLQVFVNVHPGELLDDELLASDSPLSWYAQRVTLEITERGAIERVPGLGRRIRELRDLGYRLALDDLGAGQSALAGLHLLEPDVVKLDASLVRGIDRRPAQQHLVAALVRMLTETAAVVVGEAVETAEERDALVAAGVTLQQGFLFARPGPAWPTVAW